MTMNIVNHGIRLHFLSFENFKLISSQTIEKNMIEGSLIEMLDDVNEIGYYSVNSPNPLGDVNPSL